MPKKETRSWNNVPFKTWKYEGQTKMKHKVFSYYLPIWCRILGVYNKNLNYVDGFGGIGAYHIDKDVKKSKYISDCFGSPVISIQTVHDLQKSNKILKANITIIDEDSDNIKNIKKILKFKGLQSNKVNFEFGDFDKKINKILDYFEKNQNKKLAPSFLLLDPFGISGIKLCTLKRIMNMEKTEILLNFMYNSLQRWIDHPNKKIQNIYDEYFGGDEWRTCKGKYLYKREEKLISIFRNKCKNFSKYVYQFRLSFPDKKQTYYYLFHLTNHWLGCSLMKDSFAKFNDGKCEYMGEKYQSSLFESVEQKDKKENFRKKLVDHYKGRTIKCINIFEKFIDETDLLLSEIKEILKKLEEENKISVKAFDNRGRRGGFNEKDILIFK